MRISGVAAAIVSSSFGGSAIAVTRFVVGATDPLTLGALRFGIGVVLLVPIAILARERWPERGDWVRVAGLGLLFFCLFPILFNASASFTTAARAAMALSTLPLLTLLIGAMLGVEPLTWRKGIGVLVAMAGVSIALISGLSSAPAGAWRGDLLMAGAALCMALYSIWSKPIIQRSGAITFTTGAMAAGAVALFLLSALTGGLHTIQHFNGAQWDAVLYLGIFGAAVSFFFWSLALRRTTPTRVTVSMTVNPILAASVGAVLLGEPIGWPIIAGLLSVAAGIWITVTSR